MIGRLRTHILRTRKVRTPQDRAPAKYRWRRLQGKCNRNKPPIFSARMERWSKSPPPRRQRFGLCKPRSVQDRRRKGCPPCLPISLEPAGDCGCRQIAVITEFGLRIILALPVDNVYRLTTIRGSALRFTPYKTLAPVES